MRIIKILIVDDNELMRAMLSRLLSMEGAVDTAEKGREGLSN